MVPNPIFSAWRNPADPVALDKACADMVIQAPILHGNNCLATAHEHDDLCGCDKFHLMHPDTDWLAGLRQGDVSCHEQQDE